MFLCFYHVYLCILGMVYLKLAFNWLLQRWIVCVLLFPDVFHLSPFSEEICLSFFESMVYFLKIQCQVCFLHIKLFLVENLFPPSAFSLWNMTTGIFVKIELWQNITSINMTIWRAKWLLASTSYIPSQVAPPQNKVWTRNIEN